MFGVLEMYPSTNEIWGPNADGTITNGPVVTGSNATAVNLTSVRPKQAARRAVADDQLPGETALQPSGTLAILLSVYGRPGHADS